MLFCLLPKRVWFGFGIGQILPAFVLGWMQRIGRDQTPLIILKIIIQRLSCFNNALFL